MPKKKSYKVVEIVDWRNVIEFLSEEEKREALRYFIRIEQMARYSKEYYYLRELKMQNQVGKFEGCSKLAN